MNRYQKITCSFNPCIEDLPGNVMADIISRLPVKKIIHCKSVCKNWREIVSDSYFINLHLSRSPRCVITHHKIYPDLLSESDSEDEDEDETGNSVRSGVFKCVEIEGEVDTWNLDHAIVTTLDLKATPIFKNARINQVGSVNGLVCLWQCHGKVGNTYVCNPVTREYVILPRPQYTGSIPVINSYGFGVGLLTKEYKVIWMFLGPRSLSSSLSYLLEAEVCTLGTGQWRRLGHVPYCIKGSSGFFLNGCVHWIVRDKHSPEKLCSFNIDNETFELFPSPPSIEIVDDDFHHQNLGILNGCLSLSDSSPSQIDFTVWVMKEYGFKKSWCKEVVIKRDIIPDVGWYNATVYLIESLDDGTILMLANEYRLLVYCPRKKTIERREFRHPYKHYFTGKAYRPSFLKLHTSESERVNVF